jgi:hypothetical protein
MERMTGQEPHHVKEGHIDQGMIAVEFLGLAAET